MSIASVLNTLSVLSGVLPVLAALYNYKYLDKILKIASVLFLIAFLTDLVLELMSQLGVRNNMPMIHLFTVINILFFTAIYYHAFFKPLVKNAILALAASAMLIVIFNIIFIEGI